ncbi:MAG: glutathione S-transferase family protein [Polyangiaceae bacterium]
MSLLLYSGSGSPYAWRVELALGHKGADYTRELLSFSARDTHKPEFARLNPRKKVPVLVDGDFVLFESAAIVEYLEERLPDAPSLFPGGVRERALIRRMVREVDGEFQEAEDKLSTQLFFKKPHEREQATIESGRQGMLAELGYFESLLSGDYLCGALSAADFALYPFVAMLARYELRVPTLGLTAALGPRLAAWKARIESLPYFERTYPPHWRG